MWLRSALWKKLEIVLKSGCRGCSVNKFVIRCPALRRQPEQWALTSDHQCYKTEEFTSEKNRPNLFLRSLHAIIIDRLLETSWSNFWTGSNFKVDIAVPHFGDRLKIHSFRIRFACEEIHIGSIRRCRAAVNNFYFPPPFETNTRNTSC